MLIEDQEADLRLARLGQFIPFRFTVIHEARCDELSIFEHTQVMVQVVATLTGDIFEFKGRSRRLDVRYLLPGFWRLAPAHSVSEQTRPAQVVLHHRERIQANNPGAAGKDCSTLPRPIR